MRMNTLMAGAALAAAVLTAGVAQAAGNLIQNGGFETGSFTNWTQFGDTDASGVTGSFAGQAPTEGQFQSYFGPVGFTGGITQNVSTNNGAGYLFEFDLLNLGDTPSSFSAKFGGTTYLSLTDSPAQPYTHYAFSVLATGATTAVTFTTRQDPSYWLLDNISVVQTFSAPSAAPEPASWALMLTGFFGAGAFIRRRRVVAA